MRTRVRFRPGAAALAVAAAMAAVGEGEVETLALRAARVHRQAIVVDAHQDVGWALRRKWADLALPGATAHVDIPRLKAGGVTAPVFALYVPYGFHATGRATAEGEAAADAVARAVATHPADLVAATTVAEIRAAKRQGRIAVLQAIEGGHVLGDSLEVLRSFHRRGVRIVTLTHSGNLSWAGSSGPFWLPDYDPADPQWHQGLTDLGRRMVREMNRLGVAVDVSHASDETLADALAASRAPVFASHSSCRALTRIPRNLSDDQIRAIAGRGGVVMVTIGPGFVSQRVADASEAHRRRIRGAYREVLTRHPEGSAAREREVERLLRGFAPPPATLADVVDHVEHALRLAPGAVGIGTDFDGLRALPRGLEDVSSLPAVTEELLRRGHSEEEVRGVLGESFLRFLARVEAVSRGLATEPPDVSAQAP